MNMKKMYNIHNTVRYPQRPIEYIVIHYTAGVASSKGAAENTINWYLHESSYVSSDYVVDDDKCIQYNGDISNRYTWHCGGANYGGAYYGKCTNVNSIGIEICCYNDTGRVTNAGDGHFHFTAKALKNAVELVNYLMNKYRIPPENVIRHYDVTGKVCPGVVGWFGDNSKQWEKFKDMIGNIPLVPQTYTVTITAEFTDKKTAEKYYRSALEQGYKAQIK